MNSMDATALPMFDCFAVKAVLKPFPSLHNRIALTQINPKLSTLTGAALHFGRFSSGSEFDQVDGGRDAVMNRIIWYATRGKQPYPTALAGQDDD